MLGCAAARLSLISSSLLFSVLPDKKSPPARASGYIDESSKRRRKPVNKAAGNVKNNGPELLEAAQ
jgi:hypothetical protein